jgi:hypothetical protein
MRILLERQIESDNIMFIINKREPN